MKSFKQLTEARGGKLIVVDIQPDYKRSIYFNVSDFAEYLMGFNEILYLYNGEDTVGTDNKASILEWLHEASDYNDDVYDTINENALFIDKGYAFFRAWMDLGADFDFIVDAAKWMLKQRVNDSREIDPEDWMKKYPNDWQDWMEDDPLSIPDIPKRVLKQFNGATVVGGGENECLAEMEIVFDVYNIRYKKNRRFIY